MEHRGAETGKPGKRMRYLELETTYSEIVVLTQSANVGTSDGLLTRLAPGMAQEGERRIVEFERTSRPNQSSGEQAGEPALENCQRWKCVYVFLRGGAWRPTVVRHDSRLAAGIMTSDPGRLDSENGIN